MKKKQALALFLALSIVLSSNSFTVLAAELQEPEAAEETLEAEEAEQEEAETEEPMAGETEAGPESAVEPEVKEAEPEEIVLEETESVNASAMLTFVDETGLAVTYDANVTDGYRYTVVNGVLTKITTEEGNAVSGNVVLAADKGITAVGTGAFQGNTEITYVKLPDGVKSIEAKAFYGCTSLKGISLPAGTETIGESALEGCSSMTQLALPKSLVSIGNRAFYGNSKLFMVYMKDAFYSKLETIGDSAFYGCAVLTEFCSDTEFVLPGALKYIGDSAFYNCRSVRKAVLPDTLQVMRSHAFQNCTALTEVSLSAGLEEIPDYAFSGCSSLVAVNFANGNAVIGSHTFDACFSLGAVSFPFTMNEVKTQAFINCSGLKSVEIPNGDLVIGEDAFPDSGSLSLIGFKTSSAERYANGCNIRFVAFNSTETVQYFQCRVQLSGTGNGGLILTCADKTSDPNAQNNRQGVAAGEEIYVKIPYSANAVLVEGSLRYNGIRIGKNETGEYVFKMPAGGALITAEFESTGGNSNISGIADNVEMELSNGSSLKIGQYTRLFLLDNRSDAGTPIPVSKITFNSSKPEVASVSSSGVIKAKAVGDAKVTAKVTGGDGRTITREVVIHVTAAKVETIRLQLFDFDPELVEIIETEGEVPTAAISRTAVKTAKSFQIKATAYDEEEDSISVALKWSTSDSNVAILEKTTTDDAKSTNTITIPANANGEATITVTATNPDKTVKTQKYLISIRDYTPRLESSALTLNPNQTEGTELEIISAYGKKVDADSVKLLYSGSSNTSNDFTLEKISGTDNSVKFSVQPAYATLPDGKYSLKASVNAGNKTYQIPFAITVKRSVPNPKLSFDKKQQKVNLFYINDGTEVKPIISNLGSAVISKYALEPFSDSEDDKLFTENFQVDADTGVITRKGSPLLYTSKKKPAVSGYLVIRYEGYLDKIEKKFRITIPTTTVKPSWQLNKTSDTYNTVSEEQTVTLQLLDKKTKKMVVLDDTYTVTNLATSTTQAVSGCTINEKGEIELQLRKNPDAGTVNLKIENEDWASGQSFTYSYKIKTTGKDPKLTLKSSTVSLNTSCPEQTAAFYLKSDQYDTRIAKEQPFIALSNSKNAAEYDKLSVTYEGGEGKAVILDSSIKPGTYKFYSYLWKENFKGESIATNSKVTLSVKVSSQLPSVTGKGTPALNLAATDLEYNYTETAVLPLSVKGLPQDYVWDEEKTTESIVCTTKDTEGLEDSFLWKLEDNMLKVSLKKEVPAKSYSFKMTPVFELADGDNTIMSKSPLKFTVKVYKGTISVTLTGKGKLNLLDRESETYTEKNSIVYTPKLSNLKDTVAEARVYDASLGMPQFDGPKSRYFDVEVKDGKLYVFPKAGAELENNKSYQIKIWMKLTEYETTNDGGGIWYAKNLTIKTAQVLPAVTVNRTGVNLYLSNKEFQASFTVTPKAGSMGEISGVEFDEKDTKSRESFEVVSVPQEDGSIRVTLKLKNTVSYAGGTTNKVKLYVRYKGQGTNTAGTQITMNVKVNK